MKKILFGLSLLLLAFNLYSQQVARGLTAANGQFIGFYEFKPYDYDANPTKKYPVIIFLHGIGERGNGTTELPMLTWHAIPRIIAAGGTMTYTNPKTGQKESFIVLSPQLSKYYGYWDPFYVDEMLKYARQNFRVDENKIYLTGLSAGGGGVWRHPTVSLSNAQNFAALVPVCGTCDWNPNMLPSTIIAAKNAVWAFHALDDYIVSPYCTNAAIDNLLAMNPSAPIKRTIYPYGGHYIWEIVYTDPAVFEWMLANAKTGSTAPPPVNAAPVAKAGSDQSITLPTNSVTLTNSGSFDSDGTINAFNWSVVSGPAQPYILSANSASTQVTNLVAGTYTFRLTVADNAGALATDDLIVTVAPATTGTPPVANAGDDVSFLSTSYGFFNGTKSAAGAGSTIAKVAWTQVSGPSQYFLTSPGDIGTFMKYAVPGTYTFRLTVTASNGMTATDDVVATVTDGSAPVPVQPQPTPVTPVVSLPVANAGADLTFASTAYGFLNGSKSAATGDATIVKYQWSKISGPSNYYMLTPTEVGSFLKYMDAGTYTFRLTVTDSKGNAASDDVVVTVTGNGVTAPVTTTPAGNLPTANAGADITMNVSSFGFLNGSKSAAAAGNTLTKTVWTKVSGPAQYWLSSPTDIGSFLKHAEVGVYTFRLTVTDNLGNSASDDVVVNVVAGATTASNGQQLRAVNEVSAVSTTESANIYPNPVTKNLNLNWNSSYKGNATVTIVDALGKQVKSMKIVKNTAQLNQAVDINALKSGIYFIRIKTADGNSIIEKFQKK